MVFDPQMNRVALHPRLTNGAFDKNELGEHRGSKELRCGLESIKDVFLTLGEEAEYFLSGLVLKFPRNPGFHRTGEPARRILAQRERYHTDDILHALAPANRYHAFDSASIERILKAKFEERTLEQLGCDRAASALRSALPKVTQRPLSVYKEAFLPDNPTPSLEKSYESDPQWAGGIRFRHKFEM